jgi:sugar O-acyltransferase (sialic acid O-acetyltransferase NeuD family)
MIKSEIRVPLLNANEPEAHLVDMHVRNGDAVEKGASLFTIETTKATTEIVAPETGFIRILQAVGSVLVVGDVMALITDSVDEPVEPGIGRRQSSPKESSSEKDVHITKPARGLAESLGLDLTLFPTDRLVTEDVVRQIAAIQHEVTLPASDKPLILIYGAGGHAKSVLEMVLQNTAYTAAGIVDDNQNLLGKCVFDIQVLGNRTLLPVLMARGVRFAANGVGGILDINVRVRVFDLLAGAGFSFPKLIHPRATVEPSSKVGEGVQVFANAYVGSDALLHPLCMINTNAVVSHDCVIEEYTHIAPGALLAGHVHVGARTLVGMGVTTAIGVRIGSGARIGNGAILLADVPDNTIIQAGRFWTGKAGAA